MTEEQARALKIGDRVEFRSANADVKPTQGTVSEFYDNGASSGYSVDFDDGEDCGFEFIYSQNVRLIKLGLKAKGK
jgi:hypothetical protein